MNPPYYDEVFRAGDPPGRPREHYVELWAQYSAESAKRRNERRSHAEGAFDRDAEVLDFPGLLTAADYRRMQKGVRQRGRALQKFLHDHYFGGQSYRRKKIIPPHTLGRMLRRTFANGANSVLRPENLQFWYAPDVIRDAAGNFRVVEDNLGFVGGMGDLEASRAAAIALGVPRATAPDAASFYRRLSKFYRAEATKCGGGKVVLLGYPASMRVTHEDARLRKCFAACGIAAVEEWQELQVRESGLYWRGERVGFVILDIDTADVEPVHRSTYGRYLRNGIQELGRTQNIALERSLAAGNFRKVHRILARAPEANVSPEESAIGVLGFWAAVSAGLFGVSHAPGAEFVNDKDFYLFVEKLILFYLREAPILKNIETHRLARSATMAKVFGDLPAWVIKTTDGKGGEEVWLGKNLDAKEARRLRRAVARDPHTYIAQRYTELSRVLEHSIDWRPLALIAPDKEIVSPFPWGRAIRSGGAGKVNISGGGKLIVVSVSAEASARD